MALVTVQRSPSPSGCPESDILDSTEGKEELKSPGKQRSFSESYFAVKGAALILPQSDYEGIHYKCITKERSSGDIQSHLQSMFYLLRPADTIKVAVKLESVVPTRNRYLAVVSCIGRQDMEESVILGIDCTETASIELVLPIWANTAVRLDGEGGFSITSTGRPYLFKPVSVQVMWSALQNLNKAIKVASDNTYIPRGLTHTWVGFYESKINTDDFVSLSEWHIMDDTISMVEPFSAANRDEDAVKKKIRTELKNIMMSVDLEDVTVKCLHDKVEESMQVSLKDYKSYIDQEMLVILGQMDSASKIEDFLYLGSEWNASNLEELKANGIGYILNISREIDNFFPGYIQYMNIQEWDELETDLMKYWNTTYEFIQKARKQGSKVFVHCRMGISRSASTVMAFLMKEYKLSAKDAFDYVKKKRSCVHPNDSFWRQLETYEGILKVKRQFELQHLMCGQRDRFFHSKSEPYFGVLAQHKDKDAASGLHNAFLGSDLYIPESSEDWLNEEENALMKTLGKPDECPYEQDFELSSRESTEESLKDVPSPNPKEDSKVDSKSFEFSGNILDILVTEDADTNQQNVSEDKCLAASEVSGSKIRPDSSWILEAKVEKDNEEYLEVQNIMDMTYIKDLDSDRDVFSCNGDNEDKVSGIWMTTQRHSTSPTSIVNESIISEETEGCTNVEVPFPIEKTTVNPDIETGIKQHYVKENIPWHPGTVKKQKYDFECLKNGQSSQKSDDDEGSEVLIKNEDVTWNPKLDPVQNEAASTLTVDNTNPLRIQDFDPSLSLPLKPCSSCSDVEEMEATVLSTSVYMQEEIMLEPGTVQKAKQEIENRNRTVDNSAVCPLQRSASLRVKRVTHKSKDRNGERRRTCTPVLPPSSASMLDLTCKNLKNLSVKMIIAHSSTVFHGNDENVEFLDACDQPIDKEDLAVYKFGDEEVSLQKGIVKRQKMDIEQKSKESSPVMSSEHAVNFPTSEHAVNFPSSEHAGIDYLSHTEIHSDVNSELSCKKTLLDHKTISLQSHLHDYHDFLSRRQMLFDAIHPIDVKPSTATDQLHFLSEKTSEDGMKQSIQNIDKNYDNISQSLVKSCILKDRRNPIAESSRFDTETLELIRDIGSALLNNPAKLEKEEDEDGQEKCGLVKYFVRNIEEKNKSLRKRSKKDIIIVDKEPYPQKTENKNDCEKRSKLQHPFNKHSFKREADAESATKKHLQNGNVSVCANSLTSDVHHSKSTIQAKTVEKSEENVGHCADVNVGDEYHGEHLVKCLVGIFEHCDENDSLNSSFDSSMKQTSLSPLSPYRDIVVESRDEKSEARLTLKLDWQTGSTKGMSSQRDGSSFVNCTDGHYLVCRPKSAEDSHGATPSFNFRTVSGGSVLLQHSDNIHSTQEKESFFTWEGEKIRKLTGKSHPLTKLENQGYWTQRNNPFYNTM